MRHYMQHVSVGRVSPERCVKNGTHLKCRQPTRNVTRMRLNPLLHPVTSAHTHTHTHTMNPDLSGIHIAGTCPNSQPSETNISGEDHCIINNYYPPPIVRQFVLWAG